MKKLSSARRVPRKIGQDEDEPASATDSGSAADSEPTLKRPATKARKSSALRTSFRPSEEDDEDEAAIVAPKRSNLSRVAVQRNALQRSSLRDAEDTEGRPSYSAASLQELKDSTPTTPRDLTATDTTNSDVDDVSNSTRELDLSSKFGSSLSRYSQTAALPSAIPSATEIAEKKARRARLAKEQAAESYISLDPDDPNLNSDDNNSDTSADPNVTRDAQGRLILAPKDKYGQSTSRLAPDDDEDILENYDDFTEPTSKLAFSRAAEADAAQRRKKEISAQIAEAEGSASDFDSDEEGSDASDRARTAAFEEAQTRAGMASSSGTHSRAKEDPTRPHTPSRIAPLPTLDAILSRLKTQLANMQTERARQIGEMAVLQREKIRLAEEEGRIQRSLRETGEKFRGLREERGVGEDREGGGTPLRITGIEGTSRAESTEVESVNGGGGGRGLGYGLGMGMGMGGRGLESMGSSAVGTPVGNESSDAAEN